MVFNSLISTIQRLGSIGALFAALLIAGVITLVVSGCGGGGTTSSAAVDRSGTVGIQTTDGGGVIGGSSTNTLVLDPNQPSAGLATACPVYDVNGALLCSCESRAQGLC